MEVKILHAADLHLDSPFRSLSQEKAAQRRREQRRLLQDIAGLAQEEKTDLMLLAGDLFDSSAGYYETAEALTEFFASVHAQIVIAPGNHDYLAPGSPWTTMALPDNVHIFSNPAIRSIDLPSIGCRVWGAGFTSPVCPPLMDGFRCPDSPERVEIMVLHGELNGERYNPITAQQIADSRLDYVALGHVHSYSGILTAGTTAYAYPGCPEGRGFDETGEKGVIVGTVGKHSNNLRFVPTAHRRYQTVECDVTGAEPADVLEDAAKSLAAEDVVRFVLRGEYAGKVDVQALADSLRERFYSVQLISRVTVPTDLWSGRDANSLRGIFLDRMKKRYEGAQDPAEQEQIMLAVRYGLAALDGREEWSPVC